MKPKKKLRNSKTGDKHWAKSKTDNVCENELLEVGDTNWTTVDSRGDLYKT